MPACAAMQNGAQMGARMLEIPMHGVSTRNYKQVIPTMAETVGVSKSAVSRRVIEASEAEVEALLSRRFEEPKRLVIYIDGLLFGDYTMIGAVGVDSDGNKHVLGIREGATENSTVVKELLEDIVARDVDPKRKMLFVIDGSKALRAATDAVFGAHQPVQRCPAHKLRNAGVPTDRSLSVGWNVLDHAQRARPGQERVARGLETRCQGRHGAHPQAGRVAGSGLSIGCGQPAGRPGGMLHHQPAGPAAVSDRCLATTNIIESPHAGVRIQTRRVTHWQNGKMVIRWLASAFIRTEKRFNKIMGYRDLWALEAILNHSRLPPGQVAA